jgi:A/G-specific adenine glycosylase
MPPKRAPAGGAAKTAPKRRAKPAAAAAPGADLDASAGAPAAAAALPPVPDLEDVAFDPGSLPALRAALLDWYDANHRVLPWRRNARSRLPAAAAAAAAARGERPAPADLPDDDFVYYVWVCEIMSQQTQVARAAEYFRRWVARWPTVAALAAASQEEVNGLWAGLGYYRRARFLLEGARLVAREMGGVFPRTAAGLLKIPGVGPYTAAAIASIACGERAAVVDGNVVRVLARLRRAAGDPKTAKAARLWADLAAAALDPGRPGDFNQAVMELGATVCAANAPPACGACPVVSSAATLAGQSKQKPSRKPTGQPANRPASQPTNH